MPSVFVYKIVSITTWAMGLISGFLLPITKFVVRPNFFDQIILIWKGHLVISSGAH